MSRQTVLMVLLVVGSLGLVTIADGSDALLSPEPILTVVTPPFPPVGPPPGTLGTTYLRPSRLIPEDRHPRTAMIDVWAPGAISITANSTTGYRHSLDGWQDPEVVGLWHFETDEPLTPGVPHLCDVTATYCSHCHEMDDVQTIRLIRGRVVSLDYCPVAQLDPCPCRRKSNAEPPAPLPSPKQHQSTPHDAGPDQDESPAPRPFPTPLPEFETPPAPK